MFEVRYSVVFGEYCNLYSPRNSKTGNTGSGPYSSVLNLWKEEKMGILIVEKCNCHAKQ